jgi:hypothetical protein
MENSVTQLKVKHLISNTDDQSVVDIIGDNISTAINTFICESDVRSASDASLKNLSDEFADINGQEDWEALCKEDPETWANMKPSDELNDLFESLEEWAEHHSVELV